MTSIRLGRMENPVRGFLHGMGAIAAVVGLVALIVRSNGPSSTAAVVIYGASLIAMYITSATYHSVPWSPEWKARLQILDHTFIYVLVAGTFTPLLVMATDGLWLVLGLSGIWGLAALGLTRELVSGPFQGHILRLQFAAASLVVLPALIMLIQLDIAVTALTLAGGAAYLLGTFFFVRSLPRLVPGIFSHHEFFHVVVIVASILHFSAVWRALSV